MKATRLTPRGDSIEAPSNIPAPPMAKIDWRMAKWKGSPRFMRAAAAGLAAKDSRTPMTISTATLPSSQRSMVHHHMPTAERSERAKAWWEVMRAPP